MSLVDTLMRYEDGELSDAETLDMFAALIKSGDVWRLQGHYGRTAQAMISAGLVTADGAVTQHP